jgi:phosphoribosylformimino-5-aminoimidazole carboxamide ribotide isomerase
VKQVNLGSIAVKNPDIVSQWITEFGADRIIISADVKGELVSISGWLEDSKLNVADFISGYRRKGISFVTCTDISTDGMLSGPNIELYKKLLLATPDIRLIASGGVSNLDDLRKLKEINVEGAIVGKAIYEGHIRLNELKDF